MIDFLHAALVGAGLLGPFIMFWAYLDLRHQKQIKDIEKKVLETIDRVSRGLP